ncbi:hypothetical protein EJ110_NYTH33983 [Nymphaea thermarum]|nr:hypothetical protein EJ110_NYTH33983 [Nymphaea thermarum]
MEVDERLVTVNRSPLTGLAGLSFELFDLIWQLKLTGYRTLSQDVEEGICQVLAHMWLESEIMSGSGSNGASTSGAASSSSSSSSSSATSKKGMRSQFERKLGEFFIHQIESDSSAAYGDGFRAGNQAVLRYGLRRTLDHIRMTGMFPC